MAGAAPGYHRAGTPLVVGPPAMKASLMDLLREAYLLPLQKKHLKIHLQLITEGI